jgi:hypothetical protein
MMRRLHNPTSRRTALLRTCALIAACACAANASDQGTRADVLAEERAAKAPAGWNARFPGARQSSRTRQGVRRASIQSWAG